MKKILSVALMLTASVASAGQFGGSLKKYPDVLFLDSITAAAAAGASDWYVANMLNRQIPLQQPKGYAEEGQRLAAGESQGDVNQHLERMIWSPLFRPYATKSQLDDKEHRQALRMLVMKRRADVLNSSTAIWALPLGKVLFASPSPGSGLDGRKDAKRAENGDIEMFAYVHGYGNCGEWGSDGDMRTKDGAKISKYCVAPRIADVCGHSNPADCQYENIDGRNPSGLRVIFTVPSEKMFGGYKPNVPTTALFVVMGDPLPETKSVATGGAGIEIRVRLIKPKTAAIVDTVTHKILCTAPYKFHLEPGANGVARWAMDTPMKCEGDM